MTAALLLFLLGPTASLPFDPYAHAFAILAGILIGYEQVVWRARDLDAPSVAMVTSVVVGALFVWWI